MEVHNFNYPIPEKTASEQNILVYVLIYLIELVGIQIIALHQTYPSFCRLPTAETYLISAEIS